MKKKNKIYYYVFLTILALAVGIFIFKGQLFTIYGSTTLGLSTASFASNYAPLNGSSVYIYTFVQGELASFAEGWIEPEDFNNLAPGDIQPNKTFQIGVYYDDQQCLYTAVGNPGSNSNDIYSTEPVFYEIEKLGWGEWGACSFSASNRQCPSGYYTLSQYCTSSGDCEHGGSIDFYSYCDKVCALPVIGKIGYFSSPSWKNSFDIAIETYYGSQHDVFVHHFDTLEGDTKALIGNNFYAVWDGDLTTGRPCSDKDPYKIMYKSGKWEIIDESAYDTYKNQFQLFSTIETDNDYNVYKSLLDTRRMQAMNIVSFGSNGKWANRSNLVGGQYILDRVEAVGRPVVTIYAKVSYMGIYTRMGIPKINSLTSSCFQTGTEGMIQADIQNVGNQVDNFALVTTCNNGFSSRVMYASLLPNAIQTINIPLIAQTGQTVTNGNCNVKMCGVDVNNCAYDDVNVCVNNIQFCTAGVRVCKDGDVKACNNEGTDYNVLIQDCSNGCAYNSSNNNVPYCIGSGGGCIVGDRKCKGADLFACESNTTDYTLKIKTCEFGCGVVDGLSTCLVGNVGCSYNNPPCSNGLSCRNNQCVLVDNNNILKYIIIFGIVAVGLIIVIVGLLSKGRKRGRR